MFEWNDEDGLTDAIWGDLIDREDHIVPYPKTGSDDALFRIEDYSKLKDEKICGEPRSYEQIKSSYKNEFSGSNPDPNLQYRAELSDSRFCMDSWSNYPAIESSLRKNQDGNDPGSTSSCIFNDFTETPEFDRARECMFAELSHHGNIENDREHGQKEVDTFLDCDWASITDFDDFDGIFRTSDSLGQDELSSLKDSDSPHPQTSENKEPHGKRLHSGDHKVEDAFVVGGKTESYKCTAKDHPTGNGVSSKVHEQKKLMKSRRKAEEKSAPNAHNVASSHSQITIQSKHLEKVSPVSAYYPSAAFQHTQLGEPAYLGYYPSQQMVMGYGYPAPPFPSVPLVPFVPTANRNPETAWASNVYHGNANPCKSVQNQQEKSSKPLTMTPQEKIEKLRRRQQMQALLAIKQQEKQFGQQVTSDDVTLSQVPPELNPILSSLVHPAQTEENVLLSELKLPLDQEESHNISVSSDDCSLLETVFYELNDCVAKLDHNVRLCMRDSLFRLAKSAMERRRANNGNITRIIKDENDIHENQETCHQERLIGFVDVEADTNPIDRTVAHLLFHKPPHQSFSAPQRLSACDDGLDSKAGVVRAMNGKEPL